MKCDRTVTSGSTIEGGGAILISPRVQETGSGTALLTNLGEFQQRGDAGRAAQLRVEVREVNCARTGRPRIK
jgi:hypothetical protein